MLIFKQAFNHVESRHCVNLQLGQEIIFFDNAHAFELLIHNRPRKHSHQLKPICDNYQNSNRSGKTMGATKVQMYNA